VNARMHECGNGNKTHPVVQGSGEGLKCDTIKTNFKQAA
jgi:hypothetical protein